MRYEGWVEWGWGGIVRLMESKLVKLLMYTLMASAAVWCGQLG